MQLSLEMFYCQRVASTRMTFLGIRGSISYRRYFTINRIFRKVPPTVVWKHPTLTYIPLRPSQSPLIARPPHFNNKTFIFIILVLTFFRKFLISCHLRRKFIVSHCRRKWSLLSKVSNNCLPWTSLARVPGEFTWAMFYQDVMGSVRRMESEGTRPWVRGRAQMMWSRLILKPLISL